MFSTNTNNFHIACLHRAVLEIQMALCVFAEVFASLWPQDPTPRLLNRLLVEYEYGAASADSERERCRQGNSNKISTVTLKYYGVILFVTVMSGTVGVQSGITKVTVPGGEPERNGL